MTPLQELRAAIVAKLEAIDGIGVVQDHERYTKSMSGLKPLYVPVGEQQLRGWFVRRLGIAETSAGANRRVQVVTWRIQGLMALDDSDSIASELTFDNLIETIGDTFRADPTLGGLVLTPKPEDDDAGVQVVDSGPVFFADVLCHGARLALTTRQLIQA
jgi:hypothetical protein